jgi:hypothetical protein
VYDERHLCVLQMREAARELKQLEQQFIGSVDLLQRGRKLIKVRAWGVLARTGDVVGNG